MNYNYTDKTDKDIFLMVNTIKPIKSIKSIKLNTNTIKHTNSKKIVTNSICTKRNLNSNEIEAIQNLIRLGNNNLIKNQSEQNRKIKNNFVELFDNLEICRHIVISSHNSTDTISKKALLIFLIELVTKIEKSLYKTKEIIDIIDDTTSYPSM